MTLAKFKEGLKVRLAEKLLINFFSIEYHNIVMECSDGFRRRAAIIASNNQLITAPEMENFVSTEDNLGKDKFIKFKKLNASNHAILYTRKK